MSGPYQTLIFDLDGTLIDSSPSILAGFAAALAAHNIAPRQALTADIIGPPLRETLTILAGSDETSLIDSLAAAFKAYYDTEGYKATTVFPGIDAMLRQLHSQGIALHIATNKRLLPTQLILEHLGWTSLFTSVYALDLRTPSFPNKAAMIAGQLTELCIPREGTAYVGDRPEDGHAADANGLDFFAAEWGYSPFPIENSPANWLRINTAQAICHKITALCPSTFNHGNI